MRLTNLFRHISVRAISIGLTLSLMIASTPAAPQTIVAVAKESSVSFLFWFRASGLAKTLQLQGAPSASLQEKQADRDAKVSRIQIFPGDVTIDLSDRVRFSAVAYDPDGNAIGGIKVKWSAQSVIPGLRVRISQLGEFEGMSPGSFVVAVEAVGKTTQVTVVVRPGVLRNLNLTPTTSPRQVSSRDVPAVKVGSRVGPPQTKTASGTYRSGRVKNRAVVAAKRSHAALVPVLPGDGWDDSNYSTADDPGNGVGNPPGAPLDGGAGSGNFQFAAPVYGAPGRGINIALGLAYNSRVWNKADNQINFDNDRGWPAPGFSLGFGKLLGMGVLHGGMLVDADGTRHGYTGSITGYSWGTNGVMHTTDGSFIDYSYWTSTGGGITNAQARLANGTVINYGAPGPGAVYPTSIEDANGNLITITYLNNAGPRIQTITDTLNRTISFYYDYNNLLTAITAPGLSGGTRTLVRLHYHQLNLSQYNNYGFSTTVSAAARDPYPWVVDAIYYPATSTGYWLNDSDSYSTYGMLAKVVEQRGMGFSAASLNDMGSVSQGQTTRTETYNYPLSPDYSLTDAPAYTSMTESWTRDGTNFDSAITTYAVNENSSPRTVTITLPNGTKSTQQSFNHPGQYDDGLVFYDETRDAANTLLQSSSATWQPGAYDSPRPLRVEKTDERGQMTAAEFSYGSVYNQVTEVRDYDYVGTTLLRATRTTYQNSANYTNRHIFNLPLNVEVYASDNVTRVSRTEYQYDGQTLSAAQNVVQHDQAANPHAADEGYCYSGPDWSDGDCNGSCLPNCPECIQDPTCDGYCPQIYYCPYDSSTDYRGNVTQVTSYADATNLTGPMMETRRYDVTGNLVTASTACCEQTSINYTVDTQYAYPLSQTRGSATDPYAQVTSSATYDFYTGLGLSATDANGRQAQTSYDANTLRPVSATSPTGAHTDYGYDDTTMTITATTYLTPGVSGAIADQSVKLLNGRGQVRQEMARGPDSGQNQTWDAVDTIYNNLGQVFQQSRPYRVGSESPVFSTATYDTLGRTTRMTAPDGSFTETYYNEKDFDASDSYVPQRPSVASSSPGETTLVRDAWGRERWGRTDSSGRLVEVVEPNPGGNGSVASGGLVTKYVYNTLGNLITINSMSGAQVEQTRSFAYDSLGRLTAQKLAEVSATLDSAGIYQSSGGAWSDVFAYDNRSNLTSRTDARGVKTVYSYFIGGDPNQPDPLNRLQSVSWDTSGFGDTGNPILAAATVTYQYRTKASPSDLKDVTQLTTVTAAGVSTESYAYDTEGRVSSKTLTLTSRSSYPFLTDYIYDSLDRAKDVLYPAEYSNGTAPRKIVHHDYDIASRLTGLTYDSQSFASNIVYNAASQTTSLSVGTGTNQVNESYSYNAQTGLLDNQTVARGATTLLNLSYDYAGANGKRTGQLTKILNNLNHSKDRGYTYDALGRLVQATGGPSGSLWTQTYSYDRYGNRTSVTSSGYSAKNGRGAGSVDRSSLSRWERGRGEGSASDSPPFLFSSAREAGDREAATSASSPADLIARNNSIEPPLFLHDDTKPVSDSPPTLHAPSAPPSDPPTFTDPNLLVTGGVGIKALHITELRTAINNLRVRLGMSAYTWTKPTATSGVVVTGGLISAEPIIEMRIALDQALGAPSPSYAAGLALGQPILAIHIQELRDRVVAAWNASNQIPRDGHASLSYDSASNRITTAGFAYDAAGNQVRALIPGGTGSQRYRYDAANRLVQVRTDDNSTVIASYTYGDSNERLIAEDGSLRTYYVGEGGATTAEYTEANNSGILAWSKSYVYLGEELLSTVTPNGSGGESIEYHHSDGLGTRLVTDPANGSSFEQVTLPFGTALSAESTGATNRRFTSYDRSATTGLDYANNRHYDPQQGRFTQVDPISMDAVSFDDPQSLNMYAYCGNDPINQIDPDGLFWGKLWRGIKKILTNKWVVLALTAALLIISSGALGPLTSKSLIWIAHGALKYPVLVSKLTTLGWIQVGIAAALSIPTIDISLKAYARNVLGFVKQQAIGTLGAVVRVSGQTPPWNPDAGTGVGPVSSFVDCPKCEEAFAGIFDAVIGPPPLPIIGSLSQHARRALCRAAGRCPNEDTKTYKAAYYTSLVVGTVVSGAAGGAAAIDGAEGLGLGTTSKIFGRHKLGVLNRNDHLRIGWSWKGSATQGRNVFRIGIGSKRSAVHIHITLGPRKP